MFGSLFDGCIDLILDGVSNPCPMLDVEVPENTPIGESCKARHPNIYRYGVTEVLVSFRCW